MPGPVNDGEPGGGGARGPSGARDSERGGPVQFDVFDPRPDGDTIPGR